MSDCNANVKPSEGSARTLLDSLAAIAAKSPGGVELLFADESLESCSLQSTRRRFELMVGHVFAILPSDAIQWINAYISSMDSAFLARQTEMHGICDCEPLLFAPIGSRDFYSHPDLFGITGGVPALLGTTPDKCLFVELYDIIYQDFWTVVMYLCATELRRYDGPPLDRTSAESLQYHADVKFKILDYCGRWTSRRIADYMCTSSASTISQCQTRMDKIISLVRMNI